MARSRFVRDYLRPTFAIGSTLTIGLCLVSCGSGGASPERGPDRGCVPERTALPDPDGSHLRSLAWLEQRYPMVGRFGEAGLVGVSAADAPASGELLVELLPVQLTRLTGCGDDVEALVRVEFRTDDGALDETLEGTVIIPAGLLEPPEPGVSHEGVAVLEASVDMNDLRGSLSWPVDSEWTFERGLLRASLSLWGSHGELIATPEPRDPPELDADESLAAPPASPIVSWPSESQCAETQQAWTPTDGERAQALTASISRLSGTRIPFRYTGEPADTAESELQIDLEPPSDLCGYALRLSRAHLRTADGRLDLVLDIGIDLGFTRQLFFNTNYEADYAYSPAAFVERVGHVDADLGNFAHVGEEVWFEQDDVMQGELKLLGWAPGDCLLCEADSCNECSAENRSVIFGLEIGEWE